LSPFILGSGYTNLTTTTIRIYVVCPFREWEKEWCGEGMSEEKGTKKRGGKRSRPGADPVDPVMGQIVEEVYGYLKGQEKASPPQIAKALNLKVSTVMEALEELRKCNRVKFVEG